MFGECPRGWANQNPATENTESLRKNSKISVDSVAEPMKLDTPYVYKTHIFGWYNEILHSCDLRHPRRKYNESAAETAA